MSEDGGIEKILDSMANIIAAKVVSSLTHLLDRKLASMLNNKIKINPSSKRQIIWDACLKIKRSFTTHDIHYFLQDKKITRDYISGQLWAFAQKNMLSVIKKGTSKSHPNVYIYNGGNNGISR